MMTKHAVLLACVQVLDNGKLKLSRRALQIDEGAVASEEPPPQPPQLPEAGKIYRCACWPVQPLLHSLLSYQ
jgi:hypothetical protein